MPSERIQHQIDTLLDEAEQAVRQSDWTLVRLRAEQVLAFDPDNIDAFAFRRAADRATASSDPSAAPTDDATPPPGPILLSSFPGGEGGTAAPAPDLPIVGRGLAPRRPAPEPETPDEGVGVHIPVGEDALSSPPGPIMPAATRTPLPDTPPTSFANGRYAVKKFLGEGGKKQVYLAHDTLLDRDVAFALIKTEGLDAVGRDRITREARAMGRLGAHPHIVSVFDLGTVPTPPTSIPGPFPSEGKGSDEGQPYIVTELMGGGDVEGLIEKAPEHRLPLADALRIADEVCRGLEFAHAHGIVHRDLKPGNVWLTAEGTAKLGDFGLAVALDKTRLTREGMMVGTVSYMPPEQATGGEVSPRSDLYSLGAMLYELVTGRPPFVGDESVAIIGQHLNVAPVAPTWHRPDCPAGLEALILRLLEKDPSKRPASAAEARQALQSISAALGRTDLSSRPPSLRGKGETGGFPPLEGRREAFGSPPLSGEGLGERSVANPLYRRVFVGREQELRQLQAAFDAALSGQGGLAMVVGEPGIGKTSLCEQLTTYVALRGGKALVGHCYEEGSLSLPYLPFVEAMRSYVLAREPDALKGELGTGAGEVARIVSEIRDRVPVELPPPGDPDEDRWRLLHSVTTFLRNASAVQPLLLVLEDLHDADSGTLDLLVHLAHNLGGCRLMIVGTYRDVEVDRTHPLSATLAELRRSSGLLRVPLRGLTVDEVHRMYEAVRGNAVPWAQAELVHRQTEGNPLFIQEVLRYLVEEGIVIREGGRYVRADDRPAESLVPEGLRDVIGRRLSHLSPQANQALGVAAVIGRDFRLDVLQPVAGLPEEELEAALEEATGRAVVESASGRQALGTVGFRFTHAFFRQTLYEELFIPRRIRLHQRVGRALEGIYARRLDEHAAELAEHFIQSTEAADLEKALAYSELAGQRAMGVYAFGEAARHDEQALRTQEVLDPDNQRRRCELLLALSEALVPTAEASRAEALLEEAYVLADQLGERRLAFRAAAIALRLVQFGGTYLMTFSSPVRRTYQRKWTERADRNAADGTYERVRADMVLAVGAAYSFGWGEEYRAYQRRAIDLALQLDDGSAIAVATTLANGILAAGNPHPEQHEERLRLAERLRRRTYTDVSPNRLVDFLTALGWSLLTSGDRPGAEDYFRQAAEASERSHDAAVVIQPINTQALVHTLDGEFEAALEAGERIRALGASLGREDFARQWAGQATRRALLYLGRADEALADIADPAELPAHVGPHPIQRAQFLAHAGRLDEARAQLDRIQARTDLAGGAETPVDVLRYLFDAAIAVGDAKLAGILLRRFAPLANLVVTEISMADCIGRLCGGAAVLLGRPEEARGYYEQGIAACEQICFRPELALTHLHLAELLLGATRKEATSSEQRATSGEADPDAVGRGVAPRRPETEREAPAGGGQAARAPRDVRAEAMQHLDFAIAEFRAMKMQPALERALRHKEVLKA